jgi:DNA-binding NtrC family response regulator
MTKLSAYLDNLADSFMPLDIQIRALRQSLILSALRAAGNNKAKAAKLLGINRTTLIEILKTIPKARCLVKQRSYSSCTSRKTKNNTLCG